MLRKVCQGIVSTKPVSVGVDTASVIRDGDFILDWHPKASRVRNVLSKWILYQKRAGPSSGPSWFAQWGLKECMCSGTG